jgi:AhpD family alkylhydroperoxidase
MRLPYDVLAADGLKALAGVHAYVLRCGLEKPLVDLAFLRASQINGCAYCIDMHGRDAVAGGASLEKLMLVSAWREAGAYFSGRERAALEWVEVVTWIAGNQVPDEAFLAAQAEFSDKELADLTLAIGLINAYNRMAISFQRAPASLERPTGRTGRIA